MFRYAILTMIVLTMAAGAMSEPLTPHKPMSLSFGGGVTVPAGDELDGLQYDYTLECALSVRVSQRLQIGALLAYDSFGFDDEATELAEEFGFEMSYSHTRIGGFVRNKLSDGRWSPYLTGYAASCNVEAILEMSDEQTQQTARLEASDDFLSIGGGVGMLVRGEDDANLYIEARYNHVFGDDGDAHYYTLTIGADLGFSP